MRWSILSFILFAGCSLPDESSVWASFSPRDSSFKTSSSSPSSSSGKHHGDSGFANLTEFDEEDVWSLGGSLTWYWGKKDSPASWWKDRQSRPEPPPALDPRLIEALEALARQGPQEPPESTQPPTGVTVNVTTPVDHHDVPVGSDDARGGPAPETEAVGLLKLYLEADWMTQVVAGLVLVCLVALIAFVAIFKGPALIAAWRGYWQRRKARNGTPDDETG